MAIKHDFGVTDEEKEAAIRVLDRSINDPDIGFINGPELKAFEAEFKDYIGAKYTIACQSGTAGMQMGLMAMGIGPGDEVITVANMFNCVGDVIVLCGSTPVFVDTKDDDFCIDTELIESAITPKTKAIMPVHVAGHTADMDPIMDIAETNNLMVLEDACQSLGAKYKDRNLGLIAKEVGVFSFAHHKHVTVCGDGGMVVTNDEKLARQIRMLSNHGRGDQFYAKDEFGVSLGINEIVGFNYRLPEILAAIGRVQFEKFRVGPHKLENRRQTAKMYNELLEDIPYLVAPVEKEYAFHSYLRYMCRETSGNRSELASFLSKKGIHVSIHYRQPQHFLPGYERYGFKKGQFPVTERSVNEVISLPMISRGLSLEEITYVVDNIKEFYKQ